MDINAMLVDHACETGSLWTYINAMLVDPLLYQPSVFMTSKSQVLLASLAVGQRAYVMACCPSCVRPSMR